LHCSLLYLISSFLNFSNRNRTQRIFTSLICLRIWLRPSLRCFSHRTDKLYRHGCFATIRVLAEVLASREWNPRRNVMKLLMPSMESAYQVCLSLHGSSAPIQSLVHGTSLISSAFIATETSLVKKYLMAVYFFVCHSSRACFQRASFVDLTRVYIFSLISQSIDRPKPTLSLVQ
jgi:hypothetical protein